MAAAMAATKPKKGNIQLSYYCTLLPCLSPTVYLPNTLLLHCRSGSSSSAAPSTDCLGWLYPLGTAWGGYTPSGQFQAYALSGQFSGVQAVGSILRRDSSKWYALSTLHKMYNMSILPLRSSTTFHFFMGIFSVSCIYMRRV